ncbi:endonuclease/exonuclease/phosphatase family metal-dependent hydrolase [Natronocella acetinitrilica]|uniref:Endonuclease/exonuclease/phosphatase family metal-dependent hydrolase n=1 Tax=Natronocella acetinitrilica TaxID=414046 RepID=A0AAE3G3W3_9GAMM|nr:endonuclease/exonuclease/phosphatase family metal-dependent hydrolase [Natronocella acetinitrilica]
MNRAERDDGQPESGLILPEEARVITRPPGVMRVMSYNIQTGMHTRHFGDYLTRSWQHLFPNAQRPKNIDRISDLLTDFDLVGLQEVDAGSLRSGFINQTKYLSERSGFPYWADQTNRRIGRLARHSNGLLARFRPLEIREHRLPGMIPGRGALHLRFGGAEDDLDVILMHLSLGRRTRMSQLGYVAELIQDCRHAVVMGDLNCRADSPELRHLLACTNLGEPLAHLNTYPSWRPHRNIDHILVSDTLTVDKAEVVDYPLSDHLPIMMELRMPETIRLEQ